MRFYSASPPLWHLYIKWRLHLHFRAAFKMKLLEGTFSTCASVRVWTVLLLDYWQRLCFIKCVCGLKFSDFTSSYCKKILLNNLKCSCETNQTDKFDFPAFTVTFPTFTRQKKTRKLRKIVVEDDATVCRLFEVFTPVSALLTAFCVF